MALYRDIAEAVLDRVATGALAPGATLPSVRTAAAEHGTTPATVGRAYAELARLGGIDGAPRRAARGTRDGAQLARRALPRGASPRLAGRGHPPPGPHPRGPQGHRRPRGPRGP